MTHRRAHIVAIDDDPDFLALLALIAADVQAIELDLEVYTTSAEGVAATLAGDPDLVLLDYRLGEHETGLDVLAELKAAGYLRPVVILTGSGHTAVAVELLKAGASDYVEKTTLDGQVLRHAVRGALRQDRARCELERSQAALADSERRHRAVLETAWDGVIMATPAGAIISANRAAHAIFGYKADQLVEVPLADVLATADGSPLSAEGDWQAILGRSRQYLGRTRAGKAITVELSATEVPLPGQPLLAVVLRDISARKQVESRLAQTRQELERSHDDLLSMLQQLAQGAALTDKDGAITFLNAAAERMLDVSFEQVQERHWERLWEVSRGDRQALQEASARPEADRGRVAVELLLADGRKSQVEVDFRDHPADPERRILFVYDVSDVHDLRRQLDDAGRYHDIIGRSDLMKAVYQTITDVAGYDATVFVTGETGTGKELVARAIHDASPRKDGPFIPVNTAGLSDSLLASQLFGHVRGAFTGAIQDHKGVFEAAEGGTIFLDEIGDMSANVQTSLLRVLQEREITRVGESVPRPIDVRVVAATHRNLHEEVEAGRFRNDLLYRVRVASIDLPSLRQRTSDIPLLAREFLRSACAAMGKSVQRFDDEALSRMVGYSWPGNVRELRSVIEFGVIRCKRDVLSLDDLPKEIRGAAPARVQAPPAQDNSAAMLAPRASQLSDADQRERIVDALQQANGNRTAAARLIGVSRATFYRHMERLGLATSD